MKRDLATAIADLNKGERPQILLLFGDDLQVTEACRRIVASLVPEQQQGFNLERFDGRTVSWDQVEASLRTPPFLPGKKVIWIENVPYFSSRDQNRELSDKMLQLWSEGRQEEAARLLLDLLAAEGWTQERWDQLRPGSAASVPAVLRGRGEAQEELQALIEYCRSRSMSLSARPGNQTEGIGQLLEHGLPEWDVLLMTAAQVDRRARLFKRLEEKGLTLDLGIERDRTGKVSREALLQFIGRRMQDCGKTADAHAREMILARAPNDLRGLGSELDKLLDYVGSRSTLRPEDVESVMTDRGEGWIFDLTRSIGEQDAPGALRHLARLMNQGEHPLKLLAVLATELRRMLSARQLLDRDLRGSWRAGMTYEQFQKSVLKGAAPLVSRNAYADYMCFQRAAGFSSATLRAYLGAVHDADLRLKSTGSSARLVVERVVLRMCAHAPA